MIYICSLEEMPRHAETVMPSHLVSLVEPKEQPSTPAPIVVERHLRIEIHDISEPLPGHILPELDHVACLIEFLRSWDGEAPILIHCFAGISRSMAAALIAMCVKAEGREAEAARQLRRAAPHAQPNRRMIALADNLLYCEGDLIAAHDAMEPAQVVAIGPLARVPLLP